VQSSSMSTSPKILALESLLPPWDAICAPSSSLFSVRTPFIFSKAARNALSTYLLIWARWAASFHDGSILALTGWLVAGAAALQAVQVSSGGDRPPLEASKGFDRKPRC
jgi:hypothetical protein